MDVDFRSSSLMVAGTAISVIACAGNTAAQECSFEPLARIGASHVSADATVTINREGHKEAAAEGSTEFRQLFMNPTPSEWTQKLEKKFRALALLEASEKIGDEDLQHLNELSHWRDIKLNPRSPQEIRQELREGRLLENLRAALEEYVEFRESQNHQEVAP